MKAFEDNNLLNTYKVTFKIDGSADVVKTVISGQNAIAPEDVKKAYDDTNHYKFIGWDKEFTNVTSDLTVTAEFEAIKHTYATTYKDVTYHIDACACGYSKDVEHTETSEVTTKASCSANGVRTYTCSVCSGTRTEVIKKREHHVVDTTVAVDPTCSATGTMNQKCDNAETGEYEACGYTTTRVMDKVATAHKAEADYTVIEKATCEADGYKAILCEYCDAEMSRETITKRAHVYTDNGTAEKATCLATGVMNTVCTNVETDTHKACTHESTRVIEMLEHSYTGEYTWSEETKTHSQKCVNGCNKHNPEATACTFDEVVTPATCYDDGYTTYTCSVCKNSYQDDFTSRTHVYVYATGNGTSHNVTCKYNDCNYTATENCSGGIATCTAEATCEKCNTAWGEKDAANHIGEANKTKNYKQETCKEEGYTGDIHWSCCDALETKGSVVSKLAHKYETYTNNNNATCKNNATETASCEYGCGETHIREIAGSTVAHMYVTYVNNNDATCQNNATETASCKFDCGETHTREIENSKADHIRDYRKENVIEATCGKDGSYDLVTYCSVCKKDIKRETITVTASTDSCEFTFKYVSPTCVKDGYSCNACVNCGREINLTIHKAFEHNFAGETTIIEATCTQEGEKRVKCTRCDETKIVEKTGTLNHNYILLSEAVAPTCETPGKSESKACVMCGQKNKVEVYEALGHSDGDSDGKCDRCSALVYNSGKYCTCMCHSDSFFMKIIYKIASFFWKLFKINHSCDCGFEHY